MKAPRRKILWLAGGAVALALAAGAYHANQLLLIGAAYHAKMLCSGVFVSGRDAAAVEQEDIAAVQHPVLRFIRADIDRQRRSVSAGLFGSAQRVAVYRDGLGCTLAIGIDADQLRADTSVAPAPARRAADRLWPDGEAVDSQPLPRNVHVAALRAAVDAAFREVDPAHPRRTRAIVVVYDGRIVAERYAPGFSAETPQIGWSMSKTVTSALAGILVGQGRLALERPAPVPQWRHAGDPRAAITLDQLLHMTSGLAFTENYTTPLTDTAIMLFGVGDAAAYAAAKPLITAPGTRWHYSTGTSNILARVVYDAAGDSPQARRAFPRRALFDHIGMQSAVIELDPAGTFAGSAFMYAGAHDWARFGLLYLNDGVWKGERILPQGWVGYSRRPTPPPPPAAADFGAHLWLRVPEPYFRQKGTRPELPADTFHLVGHYAQFVSVIPSRKLVVVRLGLSAPWAWDQEAFLTQVLNAVTEKQ